MALLCWMPIPISRSGIRPLPFHAVHNAMHVDHKLPPGIDVMPSFFICSFLALISSMSLACSIIFPSRCFLSSSAAASQTTTDQSGSKTYQEEHILGLSDFEYSFNFMTKLSKSCCFSARFSRLRFCNSGLYFINSASSLGVTQ